MIKVKTCELQGAALDWAVAKCEGKLDVCGEVSFIGNQGWCYEDGDKMRYTPSTNWAQGGPIIERNYINLCRIDPKTGEDIRSWLAHIDGIYCQYDASALVAAMRCYVASKLGDFVEVPEELA